MEKKSFSLVTFRSDKFDLRKEPGGVVGDDPQAGVDPIDAHVILQLDNGWTIKAGIKPDVNSATVPYTEFEKLYLSPPVVGDIDQPVPTTKIPTIATTGIISFFWLDDYDGTSSIAELLRMLSPVKEIPCAIVYVEPIEYGGVAAGKDQNGAPIILNRITVLRLWFADFRSLLQPPRGGFLTAGEINKDDNPIQVKNSTLVQNCLRAMGFSELPLPDTLDAMPPAKNLQWFGTEAMTELGKLLEYTGHVLCPTMRRNDLIQRIGSGFEPTIPDGREVITLALKDENQINTVIITSAPTPVIDTYDSNLTGGPKWKFCARDHRGQWQTFDMVVELGDVAEAEAQVRSDFDKWSEPRRSQLRHDVFRFLQLDPTTFPPGKAPILRGALTGSEDIEGKAYDKGTIYVHLAFAPVFSHRNLIQNKTDVAFEVASLDGERNIIGTYDRVGFLDTNGEILISERDAHFKRTENYRVIFSVEAWLKDVGDKEYYTAGFSLDPTAGDNAKIVDLPDSTARDIFRYGGGQQAIIVQMPELRLIRLNGNTPDKIKKSLYARAKERASEVLHMLQTPVKHRTIRGFIDAEISGRVSEIKYDAANGTTMLKIDQFYAPTMEVRREQIKRMASGNFAGQHMTHSDSLKLGQSGETQPAVAVMSPPPAMASGGGADLIPVLLTRNGGDAGVNGVSVPTLTYDVRDSRTNELLGEKVAVTGGGNNGWRKAMVELAPATQGIARYDTVGTPPKRTLVLFVADEYPAAWKVCEDET